MTRNPPRLPQLPRRSLLQRRSRAGRQHRRQAGGEIVQLDRFRKK